MKYIFASDIHGSAEAVKKLLAVFEASAADKLILMGDLLYHGARNSLPDEYDTRECFELLNEYKSRIFACRGNCDSEVDQMVLEFPMMSDYNLLSLNGITFLQTHGHLCGPDRLPPKGVCNVLVYGHTHVPHIEKREDIYLLNPGSVALPKGGYPPTYAELSGDDFCIKDFSGNLVMNTRLVV